MGQNKLKEAINYSSAYINDQNKDRTPQSQTKPFISTKSLPSIKNSVSPGSMRPARTLLEREAAKADGYLNNAKKNTWFLKHFSALEGLSNSGDKKSDQVPYLFRDNTSEIKAYKKWQRKLRKAERL